MFNLPGCIRYIFSEGYHNNNMFLLYVPQRGYFFWNSSPYQNRPKNMKKQKKGLEDMWHTARLQEIPSNIQQLQHRQLRGPNSSGHRWSEKKPCGYKPRTKMNKDEQRWTKYNEDNVFWVCLLCGVRFFVTSKGGGTLHQTLHSARKWLTVRSPAGKALRCSFPGCISTNSWHRDETQKPRSLSLFF